MHTGIQVGDTFRFLTNGNLVVTRTISSLATVSGDLQIGKLDSDLPSTITPAKVLPADFTAFLQFSTTLPLVCVDQESKILVRDWTAYTAPDATHTNSVAAVRLPLTETIISGDSGAPLFVLVGGELVLLGTHFQPNVFPAISSIVVAANAAMTSLGGGNELSQINLSGYTPIAVRSAVGHTHDLKTINNQSIKGTGNISISGTGGEILADGTVPFTANQPLAGFRFTGLGTPTPRSNDSARSIDVFNHVNVFFKRIYNVRAVDSNNVDLTVPVTTINGIALQAGDYVLIANQTAPSQNGLYIFTEMVSLLTRFSSDFDDLVGISVSVLDGVTLGKTRWINTNVVGGTLGVTAVTFARAYIPPAGPANSILVGAGVDARPLWATPATLGLVDTAAMQAALNALSVGTAAESWESIAKNLLSYNATITYSSGRVSTIAYADPGGTVTKTINYTGAKITSIALSGAGLPSGIPLTKTLAYTGEDVTSVTYS